jgi:hypothetical protein
MKTRPIILVGLLCLTAAACRTDPAIIALERENRNLEDAIYELQDAVDQTQDALDKCRRRRGAAVGEGEESASRKGSRRPEGRAAAPPETTAPPAVRGPELSPSLRLPQIEVPSQPLPPGQVPETIRAPETLRAPEKPRTGSPAAGPESQEPRKLDRPGSSKSAARNRLRPVPLPDGVVLPAGAAAIEARADSAAVDRIALDRRLTGGFDLDDSRGDDGIAVVVEPRDARGRLLAAPGPISVVLMDRGFSGNAARVARWDLSARQVAGLYRRIPEGEGFFLRLHWPSAPPIHSRLELYVRYVTRDGRKLEDHCPIDVTLPGHPAAKPAGVVATSARESDPRQSPLPASRSQSPSQPPPSWHPKPPSVTPPIEPTRLAADDETLGSPSSAHPAPLRARPVWTPDRR